MAIKQAQVKDGRLILNFPVSSVTYNEGVMESVRYVGLDGKSHTMRFES